MEEPKSLDRWKFEIATIGRKHYLRFYESMLGASVSNYQRLYRALNLYGEWPVFEAIVESSGRQLTGDPLGYVVKVASEKWKENQQQVDAQHEYEQRLKLAQEATTKANDAIRKRLEKRKKRKRK